MSDNEVDQYESDGGEEYNPKAHKKLLAGVTSLQKCQFIRKTTRDEPALNRNEFGLVKPTTDSDAPAAKKGKVDINDLVNILDKTNKHLQLGKVLKKTADKKKVLPVPLEKPAAEKLQRAINYEKAREKLEKWDAVVAKQRSADHLSFPLHQEASDLKFKDEVQVPSKFRIKSEMMLEMEKNEPQIFHVAKPEEEQEDEPKLSREELIERSRELRQLRMKESQRSIKAHHQNKIKSKKYHRILKKEKMRQQIKEFELLQKTDPEAALRKIEQLDRSRIEERGLLRHRNTGSWAQNLQVRAKYDKDARKDLAEQIAISRELTAKKNVEESDDDDDNELANDIAGDDDPFNPWLKVGKSNGNDNGEVDEFVSGYRKYWQERNAKEKELDDYKALEPVERDENENDSADKSENSEENSDWLISPISTKNLKSSKIRKTTTLKGKKSKVNRGWFEEDISNMPETISKKKTKKLGKLSKREKSVKCGTKTEPIADNIDDLFDDAEDVMREKGKKKYEKLKFELESKRNKKKSAASSDDDDAENESERIDLSFKKQNQRANEDEELNGDENGGGGDDLLSKRITNALNSIKSNANGNYETENINPNDIAKVKTQHLSTALPDTIYTVDDDGFNEYDDDYHFDEEKKMTIAEAFEDDDIVAEFKREKDEEAKKNEPQEIDLSVPGWGSWGGSGIDPSKKKTKRKMILRFPAPEKRRVDNQGNVVIIENRDEKLQKHLVSTLPFPFTSVDDYEKSIRVPIGKDFIPATASKVLTKPAVTTKAGTIIEPMNENMLVNKQKKRPTKTDRRIAKIVS
ncbi:U3 small nucleolar RNA-associated protein 14 homolog A [Contarinia nasturtii]|uniref:U3 small nucleolar RNA-associated protein 14 homolog A n=1 Tax=Contarinia nasturtii TaxID=265458 RepID=UPI0012D3DEF9|nr:U3 small nucleolar RNA-associated protein 14 homolog A [Contarinia nasturtii]